MTPSVVVYGAGSVGNHFAHAGRVLGWRVHVVDKDPAALARMRDDIYPARYHRFDDAIELSGAEGAPAGVDVVLVGTPPDTHLEVARAALVRHRPRALLIEKPLCSPDRSSLAAADALYEAAGATGTRLLVGYNHRVARSTTRLVTLLEEGAFGELLSLDVDFREHWAGIFAAHPWLSGPADSYLGFSSRGGGASGEHSHALDLWSFLARAAGKGRAGQVVCFLDEVDDGGARYDRQCLLTLRSDAGLTGRVAQDVVTRPAQKKVRVTGTGGIAELTFSPTLDAIRSVSARGYTTLETFEKTRPDDFLEELRHLESLLGGESTGDSPLDSPLDYAQCRDSVLLHLAAHASWRGRRAYSLADAAASDG